MSDPKWKKRTWAYYGTITVIGFCVLAYSTLQVIANPEDLIWLLLAIPILFLGKVHIQLPNIEGRISPSAIFVIYAALLTSNPFPAVLLGAVEAAASSFKQSRDALRRTVFNIAALSLAVFLSCLLVQDVIHFKEGAVVQVFLRSCTFAILYWVSNLTFVLLMMLLIHGRSAAAAARSALLWSWAEYLVGGVVAGGAAIVGGSVLELAPAVVFSVLTYFTLRHYFSVLRQREQALEGLKQALDSRGELLKVKEHLLEEVRATHQASLETLANAIEAKDPLTHGHVKRVHDFSLRLGERIGLSAEELEVLGTAALLHDIGKLAIPEYLLFQEYDQESADFVKYQDHARLGADILAHSRLNPSVPSIVRHHHERYDGTGFPDRLHGHDIPLGARVVAVVDCMDKDRFPRRGEPLSAREIGAHLREEAGRGLDPMIVDVVLKSGEALLEELLDSVTMAAVRDKVSDPPRASSMAAVFKSSHVESFVLHGLNEALRKTLAPKEVVTKFYEAVKQLVSFSALLIFLPSPRGGSLELAFSYGPQSELAGRSYGRWLARLRQRQSSSHESKELASVVALPTEEFPEEFGRSAMEFPFVLSDTERGRVVVFKEGDVGVAEEESRILRILLEHVGPALAKVRAIEISHQQSMYDELTRLANGRHLRTAGPKLMKEALERCEGGCVAMMDLNGFKAVNDTLGHHEGDRLLVSIARMLKRHTRPIDLVARNGGDEFVMIIPGIKPDAARRRFEDIYNDSCKLWPPGLSGGGIGTSTGLAFFPMEGSKLEELLRLADERMYQDKRNKKTHQILTFERGSERSGRKARPEEGFAKRNCTVSPPQGKILVQ